MYESKDRMVSHPKHYQGKNGIEVIDVIKAFTDNLTGIEASDTANIIKYACRWNKKGGIQDLEKVLWYTQHLIDHLKDKYDIEDDEDEEDEEFDEDEIECDGNCEECEFYDPDSDDEDEEDGERRYEIRIFSASDSDELKEAIKTLLSSRLFGDDKKSDDDKKEKESKLMDMLKKNKRGSMFHEVRRFEM